MPSFRLAAAAAALLLSSIAPVLAAQDNQNNVSLLVQAQDACRTVRSIDFDLCVEDVMDTGDLTVARDNFAQREDEEQDETEQERSYDRLAARTACAAVAADTAALEPCIQDVLAHQGDTSRAILWLQQEAAEAKAQAHRRTATSGTTTDSPSSFAAQARTACAQLAQLDRSIEPDLCLEDAMEAGSLRTVQQMIATLTEDAAALQWDVPQFNAAQPLLRVRTV